jgi:kinesin family protein 3/17
MVRASYLQIYNEVISDLLKPGWNSLPIREDKKKGVFVEGLSEWAVRSPRDIYALMKDGMRNRATAATRMNDVSSRSHAVFIIIVEQMQKKNKNVKVGKLNLVDLAGSERVSVTGATGQRLEESKKINQSLSCLGNVISALTDSKGRPHIPYRDSKLTRLLEDSLGGNCKTTMIAMISPAYDAYSESLSTLKFATRAKKIKNRAKINEDLDQRALLRKYEQELKKLRKQLE